MGYVGNNGTLDTDYAASIANRTIVEPTVNPGAFRFGRHYGGAHANFDLSNEAITSYGQGVAAGGYMVRRGDTLETIAAQLWGDSSLWYKLAQANGMSSPNGLTEGQRLIIPAGVLKNHHNATTFKPFDPAETLGDVSPTTPQPQKATRRGNKCGIFGVILLVVIAVAVTVVTSGAFLAATGAVSGGIGGGIATTLGLAGAASASTGAMIAAGAIGGAVGSIVSQGVGVATGLQDKFSWKQVAMAGLSGGIGGGVGKLLPAAQGVWQAAARGAAAGFASSFLTQSIGMMTGLQSKFDFAGVAAAAVGGAASGAVGASLNGMNRHLVGAISNSASAIASAAARSVIEGTSFGDNLLAALPDVIGTTLGNLLAASLAAPGRPRLAYDPAALEPGDELAGGSGAAEAEPEPLPGPEAEPQSDAEPGNEAAADSPRRGRVTVEQDPATVPEGSGAAQAQSRLQSAYEDANGNHQFGVGGDRPLWQWSQYEAGLGWAQAREELIGDWGGPEAFATTIIAGARRDGTLLADGPDYYRVVAGNLRAISAPFAQYGARGLSRHGAVAAILDVEIRSLERTAADYEYFFPDPSSAPDTPFVPASENTMFARAGRSLQSFSDRWLMDRHDGFIGAPLDFAEAVVEGRWEYAFGGLPPTLGGGISATPGVVRGGFSLFGRTSDDLAVTIAPAARATPTVRANQVAGDAFRDEIAQAFAASGRTVRTEVTKRTPFGPRRIDIEVELNGRILGGLETKWGSSRYLPSQRAKDFWLRHMEGYPVELIRGP